MTFCVTRGSIEQNKNVFYMHCGRRHLPEQKQTGKIPAIIDYEKQLRGNSELVCKKQRLEFCNKRSNTTSSPIVSNGGISQRKL